MLKMKRDLSCRISGWVRALCAILVVALGIQGTIAQAQTVYFHNDMAGSAIAATDEVGNPLWQESYRPYGDRILKPNTANAIWFHGKPIDPGTDLSDFGARNYDPILGRFLSIDPVDFSAENIHSFNRYAYGNNNPLKFNDPDGRNPVLFVALVRLFFLGLSIDSLGGDVPGLPGAGGALGKVAGRGSAGLGGARNITTAESSPLLKRYLSESGGRWGGTATRQQNHRIATELEEQGFTVQGAGRAAEEWIPGPDPTNPTKGGTFVDITGTRTSKSGQVETVRIQTVSTLADGKTLTPSEDAAANRIRSSYPKDQLKLVPKEPAE